MSRSVVYCTKAVNIYSIGVSIGAKRFNILTDVRNSCCCYVSMKEMQKFIIAILIVISVLLFCISNLFFRPFTMDTRSETKFRHLKILAFGDSLTEGFYAAGMKFHPYADRMETVLNNALRERHLQVMVQQVGVSGEYTSHMIPRLKGYLNSSIESPYRVVSILGGTNDLALDDSPIEIAERLKIMFDTVLQSNADTLLVVITVPQSYFLDERYLARRTGLNSEIKKFVHDSPMNNRIVLVDLETLLPYYKHEENVMKKDTLHWDDHLHMTPAGYDRFGDLVAEAVLRSFGDVL